VSEGFFQGVTTRGFFKFFLGGAKSGEIRFFPLETKKTTLLKFSKSRALGLFDAHVYVTAFPAEAVIRHKNSKLVTQIYHFV